MKVRTISSVVGGVLNSLELLLISGCVAVLAAIVAAQSDSSGTDSPSLVKTMWIVALVLVALAGCIACNVDSVIWSPFAIGVSLAVLAAYHWSATTTAGLHGEAVTLLVGVFCAVGGAFMFIHGAKLSSTERKAFTSTLIGCGTLLVVTFYPLGLAVAIAAVVAGTLGVWWLGAIGDAPENAAAPTA